MNNDNNAAKKYNFFLKGTNGKAVLLIHGITGTPSEMRFFGSEINKAGYSVYCNTLPRHCQSLGELKRVTWQEIVECCRQDFRLLRKDYDTVFVAGLSMGALVAIHLAYLYPEDVKGVIALAPTLSYDGWAVSKLKFLMDILWLIPLIRNNMNIRETWPYGLKDESSREAIERFYKFAKAGEFSKKTLLFGSPFFPMACLYQHQQFVKIVKGHLNNVKTPLLVIHSKEDDMVSIRNAEYVIEHIGSSDKRLVELVDSYHMITIDKEKNKVVSESLEFLKRL